MSGLFKAALVMGVLAVALLALLVAWWIALLAAAAWLLVSSVSRLFQSGGTNKPAARSSADIIEGEYRVEHADEPALPPKADQPEGDRQSG